MHVLTQSMTFERPRLRSTPVWHGAPLRLLGWLTWMAFGTVFAQTADRPVRRVIDPGVITTRQAITPAGVQTVFNSKVRAVAFCGDDAGQLVVSSDDGMLYNFDWKQNRVMGTHKGQRTGIQGLVCDQADRRTLLTTTRVVRDGNRSRSENWVVALNSDGLSDIGGPIGNGALGGLAVAAKSDGDERRAVIAKTSEDSVAIFDLNSKKLLQSVRTGVAPFTTVVNREGTVAYVSNWGGRFPKAGDKTAPVGPQPNAQPAVIDDHGIASTGTINRLDLRKQVVDKEISVGLHPTAMYWDEPRGRLYVANGNSDTVSVVNTESNRVERTYNLQPFDRAATGIAPTSLVADTDGKRLYVACGGINAVAVLSLPEGRIEGLIPTGWYPSHVALSPDGKHLAVATRLGVGSGSRPLPQSQTGPNAAVLNPMDQRYVHAYRGSLHVIPVPDEALLASYTTAVAENSHMALPSTATSRPAANTTKATPMAVPVKAGDPSLIEHVVFVIKENRTYDQLFGDLPQGNGDPSLVLYGEDVTPNHRKLARDFVLLDNFYATGGNSGDGHQWVTQAAESDYAYWPGYSGRSYPFDGTDPIAPSGGGFIWDAAMARGRTAKIFGEYAGTHSSSNRRSRLEMLEGWKNGTDYTNTIQQVAPIQALNKILAANYPGYGGSVPDVVRAQIFLSHLKEWTQKRAMPNLIMVQLPADHTGGTSPDYSTPKACLADNDLALGQIVEGLSKSPFWGKMAIFVVEDDAQGGVDHVDGHRTVALAISPYTRRGTVDSTFYSQPSMLKTIELMLGLPTLSLFDLIANDMRASFQNQADPTPYTAVMPKQSLYEVGPPLKALRGQERRDAVASSRMDFSHPDNAPAAKLNQILWRNVKGASVPYPKVRSAVFAPFAADDEDDDDDDDGKPSRQRSTASPNRR